jgi:murein DD-endopeptidase MepM/ murein hydrolase activator NlpD
MSRKRQKRFLNIFRQIFRKRNIIVMCDQSIDQYPIGGKAQIALLLGVVGGFCWVSYSTGSYMTSQAVMEQKDRQLQSTALKTQQMGQEYSLLKHDLEKLSKNKDNLSDYAKFVLDQHTNTADKEFSLPELMAVQSSEENAEDSVELLAESSEAQQRLIARVSYLESRVENLQSENKQIVEAVQVRTRDKIKEFRDVIKMAGFNVDRIQKLARNTLPKEELKTSQDIKRQGGPFVPARLGKQFEASLDQLMLLDSIVSRLPLGVPMRGAKVTSGYGRRHDPFNNRWAMHTGVDFASHEGAPVYVTNEGVVKAAGWKGAYGNQIEINHGLGITTRYSHLSAINVKLGQKVKEGAFIGRQGSTGRSTGGHLHYEVYFNGHPLNPSNFLRAGYYVQEQEG